MRVLMTCGGTGGHINPAIAIANTIKKRIPDAEILFVGTKRGQESVLVPRAGYELKFVESEGIRRSLSLANIRAVARAIVSPIAAQPIIREFAPDVVVGIQTRCCCRNRRICLLAHPQGGIYDGYSHRGSRIQRHPRYGCKAAAKKC